MVTKITVNKNMAMEEMAVDMATPEGLLASAARPSLLILVKAVKL